MVNYIATVNYYQTSKKWEGILNMRGQDMITLVTKIDKKQQLLSCNSPCFTFTTFTINSLMSLASFYRSYEFSIILQMRKLKLPRLYDLKEFRKIHWTWILTQPVLIVDFMYLPLHYIGLWVNSTEVTQITQNKDSGTGYTKCGCPICIPMGPSQGDNASESDRISDQRVMEIMRYNEIQALLKWLLC